MTDPTTPGGTQHVPLPYPEESDEMIRQVAHLVFDNAAVKALDTIRNELLGNIERAAQVADAWARNETMNNAKLEVNAMRDDLASYWKGPAYNAFSLYAGNVVGVIDKDLALMGTMSTTMGTAVTTVYNTYSSAIALIGKCAISLGSFQIWGMIGAASALIPGVDVITTGALIYKIVDVLEDFAKAANDLISSAVTQIGQYKAQGLAFTNLAAQFQQPEKLPEATNHLGEWQVNPLTQKSSAPSRPHGC